MEMMKTYKPETLAEALSMMKQENLLVMAGGTDLMVRFRSWSTLAPDFKKPVIFIETLDELKYIKRESDGVHIGAGTKLQDILEHEETPELLKLSIEKLATYAIRHTGTLAGNIVNASPAGDTLPVLYVLNASIVLKSENEERTVPISSFITGPGRTVRKDDELVTEIIIEQGAYDVTYFKKVGGRKADAISKVCVAGVARKRDGLVEDFRIAFGAVGPTIIRVEMAEQAYINKSIESVVERVRDDYQFHIKPIDDQRSTAEYRKETALNILEDFAKSI